MSYPPIENFGIIGNLRTAALVGTDGSIDFLCFPEFDSPSLFAALLDHDKGGRFRISPLAEGARRKQLYLPETNILLTRFLTGEGVLEVSDFMPVGSADKHDVDRIVRRAKTVRGWVRCRMVCEPGFDYARAGHRIEVEKTKALFESKGQDGLGLRLCGTVPLRANGGAAVAEFTLEAGQTAVFILERARRGREPASVARESVSALFKQTADFWRAWIRRSTYQGRWREMVHRSALTLKLLSSAEHGSLVAAPTFGLPEEIGGERNWDYRFTWIRDASFTLYGLIRLGYTEEAGAFMRWIEQRCADPNPDGSLQIMYGLNGRRDLTEETLTHLAGYRGSRPVRVGNAAQSQLQLDIYGELMDSVYLYNKYGAPISYDLWRNLVRLVDWVCAHWREKDEGVWEVRGGRQEFLFSRLMCWVAVDRAIRVAGKRSFPAPLDRWYAVRDEIYGAIMSEFWDPQLEAFVQHRGSKTLDASILLMPLVRFIGPTDPRWLSTLAAIEKELVDDSLVFRYRIGESAADGLGGDEGTFSMCSFWFVENLARAGDLDKARFFFEKMLGYANHVGLYAEELGPCGEQLGNFPQAFTHLSLISAAYYLDRELTRRGR
jgi:GH15 family glucan-1,4-alpha-glucosidase